jgi:hypothetical protein
VTIEVVADRLGCSSSKVSRIEMGTLTPHLAMSRTYWTFIAYRTRSSLSSSKLPEKLEQRSGGIPLDGPEQPIRRAGGNRKIYSYGRTAGWLASAAERRVCNCDDSGPRLGDTDREIEHRVMSAWHASRY